MKTKWQTQPFSSQIVEQLKLDSRVILSSNESCPDTDHNVPDLSNIGNYVECTSNEDIYVDKELLQKDSVILDPCHEKNKDELDKDIEEELNKMFQNDVDKLIFSINSQSDENQVHKVRKNKKKKERLKLKKKDILLRLFGSSLEDLKSATPVKKIKERRHTLPVSISIPDDILTPLKIKQKRKSDTEAAFSVASKDQKKEIVTVTANTQDLYTECVTTSDLVIPTIFEETALVTCEKEREVAVVVDPTPVEDSAVTMKVTKQTMNPVIDLTSDETFDVTVEIDGFRVNVKSDFAKNEVTKPSEQANVPLSTLSMPLLSPVSPTEPTQAEAVLPQGTTPNIQIRPKTSQRPPPPQKHKSSEDTGEQNEKRRRLQHQNNNSPYTFVLPAKEQQQQQKQKGVESMLMQHLKQQQQGTNSQQPGTVRIRHNLLEEMAQNKTSPMNVCEQQNNTNHRNQQKQMLQPNLCPTNISQQQTSLYENQMNIFGLQNSTSAQVPFFGRQNSGQQQLSPNVLGQQNSLNAQVQQQQVPANIFAPSSGGGIIQNVPNLYGRQNSTNQHNSANLSMFQNSTVVPSQQNPVLQKKTQNRKIMPKNCPVPNQQKQQAQQNQANFSGMQNRTNSANMFGVQNSTQNHPQQYALQNNTGVQSGPPNVCVNSWGVPSNTDVQVERGNWNQQSVPNQRHALVNQDQVNQLPPQYPSLRLLQQEFHIISNVVCADRVFPHLYNFHLYNLSVHRYLDDMKKLFPDSEHFNLEQRFGEFSKDLPLKLGKKLFVDLSTVEVNRFDMNEVLTVLMTRFIEKKMPFTNTRVAIVLSMMIKDHESLCTTPFLKKFFNSIRPISEKMQKIVAPKISVSQLKRLEIQIRQYLLIENWLRANLNKEQNPVRNTNKSPPPYPAVNTSNKTSGQSHKQTTQAPNVGQEDNALARLNAYIVSSIVPGCDTNTNLRNVPSQKRQEPAQNLNRKSSVGTVRAPIWNGLTIALIEQTRKNGVPCAPNATVISSDDGQRSHAVANLSQTEPSVDHQRREDVSRTVAPSIDSRTVGPSIDSRTFAPSIEDTVPRIQNLEGISNIATEHDSLKSNVTQESSSVKEEATIENEVKTEKSNETNDDKKDVHDDIIDLTWIDDLDENEILTEVIDCKVFPFKVEIIEGCADEDQTSTVREVISPADSGLGSPGLQSGVESFVVQSHGDTFKCLCGNKAIFVCCSCNASMYCSKDCQYKDWNDHQILCNKMKS